MNSAQTTNQSSDEQNPLKFVAKMVKFLEGLNINRYHVERYYKRTSQNLDFDLDQELKTRLLAFFERVKNVSVDNDQTYNESSYVVKGVDSSDTPCLFEWRVGEQHSTDISIISELLVKKEVEVGYLVYLSSGKQTRIEIKQTDLKESSSDKQNDVEEEKKSEQEDMIRLFESQKLESPGLVEAYGKIEFKELFEKLLKEPNDPLNRKWITYFGSNASNVVKKPCMVALKDYFTKYSL